MLKRFLCFYLLLLVCFSALGQKRKINPIAKKQYDAGNSLLVKAKYKESIVQFKKALQTDSTFIECHMALGIAYSKLNQPKTANIHFSKVIKLIPDDHEAYMSRGLNQLAMADTNAALLDMNAAIRSKPAYAKAYFERSMLWSMKGHHPEALADINQAIGYENKNAEYHFQRAIVFEAFGNYRSAMADYDTVITLNPDLYEMNAYSRRASCKKFFKDINGTIADYTTVLKKYPGNTIVLCNRGFAYLTNKNGEAACEDFKMAQLLGNPSANGFLEKYCKDFFR